MEQLNRKVWLLGHSYPRRWVNNLDEPLDPRHPTRHSIWTPVLDRLQERVYADGNRLRLNIERCFLSNVAKKQQPDTEPDWDWDWNGPSMAARIEEFSGLSAKHRPPVLVTFGADAYRFATKALGHI